MYFDELVQVGSLWQCIECVQWLGGSVLAVEVSPMIEVRRVRQALNLLGSHPQEVDLLLVQDFTLLKTRQSITMGLQGLRWGHSLHPNAAHSPYWSCARSCSAPAAPMHTQHTLSTQASLWLLS